MYEAFRIVLFALVAAASPMALLAALAVLHSDRRPLNSIIFMAGFVLSQSVVFVAVYLLGLTASRSPRPTAAAYVELVIGVGVLAICLIKPDLLRSRNGRSSPKKTALLERLKRVTPIESLGIGALLGAGIKRLVIATIAAGILALSGLSSFATFGVGLVYIAVATSIVWLPVVYSVILGRRAETLMATVRTHAGAFGRRHAVTLTIVLGALIVIDALVRLLT